MTTHFLTERFQALLMYPTLCYTGMHMLPDRVVCESVLSVNNIPNGWRIIRQQQTHSAVVAWVDSTNDMYQSDGLVTDVPGVLLTMYSSDCIPLVCIDRHRDTVGIAHAGYRGVLGEIAKNIIYVMLDHGSKVQDIKCIIGPSIHVCCYQIHTSRAIQFRRMFPQHIDIVQQRGTLNYLDLPTGVRYQLEICGVLPAHISVSDICTCCNLSYPSYYRSHGKEKSKIITYVGVHSLF